MASPQRENGHVDIANETMEALAHRRISGEEWQCLCVVFRKTYGWHKRADCISLSQFAIMTGLKRPNVSRAITKLLSKKILLIIKEDNSYINKYMFNKNFDQWSAVIKKDTSVIKKDNQVLSKKIHTKETITKENIYSCFFEDRWKQYPNKIGKIKASKKFLSTVKNKASLDLFDKSLNNYLNHLKIEDWKRPKDGSTFFNEWKEWIDAGTKTRRFDEIGH